MERSPAKPVRRHFRSTVAACCLSVSAVHAAGTSPAPIREGFAVDIPSVGSWDNITNLARFADAPAGRHGVVRRVDGRFEDGAGNRIRFLGGGLIRTACFPTREMADALAARLQMIGINLVRIHHVDTTYEPNGFWDPRFKDKRHLDPDQLERFDYLVAQLKTRGVYTNINLHVSRKLTEADGIPFADQLPGMDKGADHIIPEIIEIQKKYARDLLTHRNPYTGTTYAEEPAVAAVEINNENSFLGLVVQNRFDRLPEPYERILTRKWTQWLRRTYAHDDAVRNAWKQISAEFGSNLLKNSDFSEGSEHWVAESGDLMRSRTEPTGPAGGPALRIDCLKPGPLRWSMQMHQIQLSLEPDAPYTFEFSMRSEPGAEVAVVARLDHAHPETGRFEVIGLNRTFESTTEWKTYRFTFIARNPSCGGDRIGFTFPNARGTHWVANMTLRKGGRFGGLAPGESLEAGNVMRPMKDAALPRQWQDWITCVAEIERDYFRDMRRFLKDDLGVRCPVIGTQASYGNVGGLLRESDMDYCDMHAYWQHPRFPGRPWDIRNWEVDNTPLTGSPGGGTLMRLASHRLKGTPFVVSEFNHPTPNWYASEAWVLTAAFAALQDWDGLVVHNYLNYGCDQWAERRWNHFFDTASRPQMTPFLPAAFMLFRRGHLKSEEAATTLIIPAETIPRLLAEGRGDATALWKEGRADSALPLMTRMAVAIVPGSGEPQLLSTDVDGTVPSQMHWDRGQGLKSTCVIDTPVVKAVVGGIGGRTVAAGSISVTMGHSPTDFAAIAVVAMDEVETHLSRQLLVSAVGRAANSGWTWHGTRNMLTSFGANPTIVEGIDVRVTIPTEVRKLNAFALDGRGNRRESVPLERTPEGIRLHILPAHQAVWYEISAHGGE